MQSIQASGVVACGLNNCNSPPLEHRLNSCRAQAYLLWGVWDLVDHRLKPCLLLYHWATRETVNVIFYDCYMKLKKSKIRVNTEMINSLGREDVLEEEMEIHFSIFAWRIPWTEDPGGLQSMGSQRVGHDWSDLTCRAQKTMKQSLLWVLLKNNSGSLYSCLENPMDGGTS